MIKGWEETPLEELIEVFLDYRGKTPPKTDEGVPLITAKIVKAGRIETPTEFISEKTYETWMGRGYPKANDVVLTVEAPLGEVALLKDSYAVPGQRIIMMRPKAGALDSRYLKYYFQSRIGQHALSSRASGTTVMGIKAAILRKMPIPYPTLREQRVTAEILSSLDDKIDLLHRQNATLEALAETLFRQNFIEEAQDDWEEGVLDNILTTKGGTTPSTKNEEYWEGDIHWTSPRDLSGNAGLFLLDTARKITEAGLAKISSGLLPKGTLLMSSRAPVGYLAFSNNPIAINQGYIGIVDDKGVSKEFIFLWLKVHLEYVKGHANGSTFQEISKSSFKQLEVQIPPEPVRVKFQKLVKPMFEKMLENTLQIQTLEKLRDTLLPKLMSGAVRVEVAK